MSQICKVISMLFYRVKQPTQDTIHPIVIREPKKTDVIDEKAQIERMNEQLNIVQEQM